MLCNLCQNILGAELDFKNFKIFMSIICGKTLPSAGYKTLSVFMILIICFLEGLDPSEPSCYTWHNAKSKQLWLGKELNTIICKFSFFFLLIYTKEESCSMSHSQNIGVQSHHWANRTSPLESFYRKWQPKASMKRKHYARGVQARRLW